MYTFSWGKEFLA